MGDTIKIITVMQQKGGVGKTTIAVHLATQIKELFPNLKVALADADPQKSATVWGDARSQEVPIVATAAASELGRVLEAADQERMTLAIVDTAPHAAPDATRIVRAVDLVAIPVRPTAFDIAAAGSAVDIVKAAGVRAVFVLSACPFRSPEIAETRTVLAEYGLPIAPVEIIDRRAFARAVATGRAVTEFESDGKAATEIRALWAWLKEQMQ